MAGAVQVTWFGLSCLQADGGSWPLASLLLFVTISAFISAPVVGLGFGLGDIAGAALGCEPAPLTPTQVLTPATTRITAASTAIQRGRRYHCGSCGPPGDGGAPAG